MTFKDPESPDAQQFQSNIFDNSAKLATMQNRLAWSSSSLSNASTGRGDEKTHDCEANHQNQNVDIDDKGALLMNASKVQASINVHTIGTTSHGALDLVRQLVLAVALLQAGYSIPRYFMIHDVANLANRSAPFQVTVAGDVILDFALNQPLIDPPTIPCMFVFYGTIVF